MQRPRLTGTLVRTAQDGGELLDWLDDRIRANEPLAIDTETAGLEWWNRDHVRLLTISDADHGWAIPIRWWGRVVYEVMRRVRDSGIKVIFHNAAYDMLSLQADGFPVPTWDNVHDTVILMGLHRSDYPKGLKSHHSKRLLGGWIDDGRDLLKERQREMGFKLTGSERWIWTPVDDEYFILYATLDTILTRRIYDALEHVRIRDAEQYQRKMRYSQIMAGRQLAGVRIDEEYTVRLQAHLAEIIRTEAQYLYDIGFEDPGSRQSVLSLLETDFGYEPVVFTDTGKPALNKEVLEHLGKAEGITADAASSLVKYYRAVKFKKTYADAFLERADLDGRIHPGINPFGTRTGRTTVTNPGLHTLPSNEALIRLCFLPNKGEKWVSIDLSNQEPRIMAHYGQSPGLVRLFTDPTMEVSSLHDYVATLIFGPDFTKAQRGAAKIFGLSRPYGAGYKSMAVSLGEDEATVKAWLEGEGGYDELVGLAAINEMIEEVAADRMPDPYVLTFGGRRVYAEADKLYRLTNYLIQGSAADSLEDSIIKIADAGYEDSIILPVHDEVTFSVPSAKADHEPVIAELCKHLEDVDISVPMVAEPTDVGRSWGTAYLTEGQDTI